jgi:hypothetical protein
MDGKKKTQPFKYQSPFVSDILNITTTHMQLSGEMWCSVAKCSEVKCGEV